MSAALLATTAPAAKAQAATGNVAVSVGSKVVSDSTPLHILFLVSTPETGNVLRRDSTDTRRSVTFSDIPAGRYRVETRVIGYVPDTGFVVVGDGKTARLTVDLKRIAALDPLTTYSEGKGHLAAFEKRRASGKGTFLTKVDLDKSGTTQVAQVLRSIRGLRVECQGSCKVQMVRSTSCEPRYFMNGFPSDAGILLSPLLDIAGIEIYRGPSETPGEFMGAQSMCGAIVLWSK